MRRPRSAAKLNYCDRSKQRAITTRVRYQKCITVGIKIILSRVTFCDTNNTVVNLLKSVTRDLLLNIPFPAVKSEHILILEIQLDDILMESSNLERYLKSL